LKKQKAIIVLGYFNPIKKEDQNNDIIHQRSVFEEMNVALIDGLEDKIQSFSWLLKKL